MRVSWASKTVTRRLAAMACAGILLGAAAARAETTFLLQLGSFGSQQEAARKWDEIKAKNADVVGKLTLRVAEVALPPDNSVSYRTQAGPIASHDQAAEACATLQGRGLECYVVETAMFTPEQSSTQTAQTAPASLPPPSAPAVTEVPPPPPAPANTSSAITYVPKPAEASPPPALANPPAADTVPATPPVIGGGENGTEVAHGVILVNPATSNAGASAPAMAQGNIQGGAPADLMPPPPPAPSDTGSAITYVPKPAEPAGAMPTFAPPAQPGSEVAPGVILVDKNGQGAASPPQERPGFFGRLFGASDTAQPQYAQEPGSNSVGNVRVSEAIRVPLGSGRGTVANLPAVHGMGGYASQNGARAYWAQLSYFPDELSARNFYDEFRAAYPQFSDGVRVRITRPYASMNSAGRVSLRVGPFADLQATSTICAAGTPRGLRCTVVRDLGTSSANEGARGRTPGYRGDYEDRSRLSDRGALDNRPMMYWAQLGSYRSPDDAWDEWHGLQDSHQRLLGRVRATVTTPSMSSAARPLFRLRVGPFVSRTSASAICNGLFGRSCLVVNDR